MNVALTGSTGFVGKNLISYLHNYNIKTINLRNENKIIFNSDIEAVIHLAGKAHDLKNTNDISSYYKINYELTQKVFDSFIESNAKIFIFMSSVKAAADSVNEILTEEYIANPITHYGKSKLLAEKYLQSIEISKEKYVYILRPCMIHGPENKGNLNLLFKLVSKGIPWPLGRYENKKSFCSIHNLCFIIAKILEKKTIKPGIYNIADDECISTNELIELISISQKKSKRIINIPKKLIYYIAKIGDVLKLPLNTERLNKLTENYVVKNDKIKKALEIKNLPMSSKEGLVYTLNSFQNKLK